MAQIEISSFPYKYVSSAGTQDTIIFKGDRKLQITVFPRVIGAGSVQMAVGNDVTIDSNHPSYDADYGNGPPMIFGNFYGDLQIKASGVGVVVNLSFA